MSTLLFPTFGMDGCDVELITEIYHTISQSFSAEFDFDYSCDFKGYELISNDTINHFGPVIGFNKDTNPFYLTFLDVGYKLNTASRYYLNCTYGEYQTWGIISLKQDYGHILIKPETILDKIHDLVNHVDIDFKDDKEFSRKFYVVANDKLKAELQLSPNFRKEIENFDVKDFLIEVVGNKLIVGNKKVIQPDTALGFVTFLNKLSRQF